MRLINYDTGIRPPACLDHYDNDMCTCTVWSIDQTLRLSDQDPTKEFIMVSDASSNTGEIIRAVQPGEKGMAIHAFLASYFEIASKKPEYNKQNKSYLLAILTNSYANALTVEKRRVLAPVFYALAYYIAP